MWSIRVNDCEFSDSEPGSSANLVALLITYGDFQLSTFDDIKLESLPPTPTLQSPREIPRAILVSFGQGLIWTLPLEDCATWPVCIHVNYYIPQHVTETGSNRFQGLFFSFRGKIYPRKMLFTHEGNEIGPQEFTTLINQGHTNINLTLKTR